MNAVAKVPVRLTVEEFLLWAEGAPGRWELVDGEPREMTPPLKRHSTLHAEVARLLGNHLADQLSPLRVGIDSALIPELFPEVNVRVPDLVVMASGGRNDARIVTDAILVVEILSPSNQAETWSNVWAYTSIGSVREIVVLRADRVEAQLLRRKPDGQWPASTISVTEGSLTLASIDLTLPVAAFYRTTDLR